MIKGQQEEETSMCSYRGKLPEGPAWRQDSTTEGQCGLHTLVHL